LFFIPKFQALGAAYISLITQSITAMAQVLIAVNIFKFKVPWLSVIRIAVFAGLVVVLGYFANHLISHRLAGYVIMLISALLLAFMVKLIDLRKLFNILRDRE
jgi:drug/metabolite transporter (DMT)-like permease